MTLRAVCMACLLGLPAWAQATAVFDWAKTAPVPKRLDAADVPAAVKAELEALAATTAGRPTATLSWIMRATPEPKKRRRRDPPPRLLVLATASSATAGRAAHAGLLLLVEPQSGNTHVLAQQPVPRPSESTWRRGVGTDVDADGEKDAILLWTHAARNFTRGGMIVARTNPPAIAMLETASKTVTGQGTRTVTALTACFFPVLGYQGKALILQRREITAIEGQPRREIDAMELLLPRSDGALSGGHVYGAMYSGDGQQHDVIKRWGKVFALRRPEDALAQQSIPGACPADAVILPQRALGQSASPHPISIVGPFAMTSLGVRQAVKALGPRAPKAMVVVGIGSL